MLPFVRMLSYGNVSPPAPKIKKLSGWGYGYPLFALYDNGELYGVGKSYNSFGDNVDATYTDWRLIRSDIAEIYPVSNNGYTSLLKTKDGKYLMSENNAYYAFPNSGFDYTNFAYVDVSTHMVIPDPSPIKKIQFNGTSVFVITENNDLYFSGLDNYYAFGTGKPLSNWTKIFSNVNMIAVSPEFYHMWIVTNDNKVYRSGINTRYCLIRGTSNTAELKSITEYIPGDGVQYKAVYSAGYLIYFVDTTDKLWIIGQRSSAGTSGDGSSSIAYTPASTFSTLTQDSIRIYSTSPGYYSTTALDGTVLKYSGQNGSGEGGVGSYAGVSTYTAMVGVPNIGTPDILDVIDAYSTHYIRYGDKCYASGATKTIYGYSGTATYVNSYIEMKLPRD